MEAEGKGHMGRRVDLRGGVSKRAWVVRSGSISQRWGEERACV